MTQITDEFAGPIDFVAARIDAIHTQSALTAAYTRRIHWWVRLFGIIWIVIPAVMAFIGFAFLLGAAGR